MFGMGFAVYKSVRHNVIDFNSSECISTLSFKSGNKGYTISNAHVPTKHHNSKKPQEIEDFWEDMTEMSYKTLARHYGDSNTQLSKERTCRQTSPHSVHNRMNKNRVNFINNCQNFNLKIMSAQFHCASPYLCAQLEFLQDRYLL